MSRVKRGMVSRRKHNKLLKLAKGYRGVKSSLIKPAHDAVFDRPVGQDAHHLRRHARQSKRLELEKRSPEFHCLARPGAIGRARLDAAQAKVGLMHGERALFLRGRVALGEDPLERALERRARLLERGRLRGRRKRQRRVYYEFQLEFQLPHR